MKLARLRISIVFVLASTLMLAAMFELRFDVLEKIGKSGVENTFLRICARLSEHGIANSWSTLLDRLNAPYAGNPTLKYSLYDRSGYPPVESPDARNALAEYKVIPAVDVATLPPSRSIDGRYDTWHRSNGDDFSSKYSSLDQINRDNVKYLEMAWTYGSGADLGDPGKNGATVETNPIFVNGRLFITSADHHLICIDAGTGHEVWRISLPAPVARRGLTWEPGDDFSKSRLFVPTGGGIYAVNPATGEILRNFGNDGQVGNGLSLVAPVIVKDKLIVAMVTPAIEAYDLRSGKLLWARPLLDRLESKGANLWGGVPWGGMSADPSRGAVFVSTGNPRPHLFGESRAGENRNSCSVVAIDAETGEIIWAFQEVSHDLWDLDIPAAPVLTTITRDGRRVDVVATVTKSGNTLLLDRDFGKPIFPYRLKRAPVSRIPGERTSPYQPALELPEPFSKQEFEEADVTDLSENARQTVQRKIRGAALGRFTPPILGGKVVLYGLHGGAEWPGAAVDPRNGILYTPSNQLPWIIRVSYQDLATGARSAEKVPGNSLYQARCAACHGPDRAGLGEDEREGDAYYPALTGITILRDRQALVSKPGFDETHKAMRLDKDVTPKELETLFEYFSILDRLSDRERSLAVRPFWQLLLDDNGYPGTKAPWGLLTAIDLNSGRKMWQVPFGQYEQLRRHGDPVKGQRNSGGAIVTAGNLVFATGTVDNKIRAFDSSNGRDLWSFDLPAAGSAPPATYTLNGTQYVVVVASGGQFVGFTGRSDKVIAFKLPKAILHDSTD
jgi:quinoprotein glucose dehydrogenase